MSTIRVDNFGPSAGGTTYSARGIAKAWVNFNGTGTIAARDSENVSSLTDNGTGDYTINLSNAFGAADFSIGSTANENATTFTGGLRCASCCPASASTIRMGVTFQNGGPADPVVACANMMGDLA